MYERLPLIVRSVRLSVTWLSNAHTRGFFSVRGKEAGRLSGSFCRYLALFLGWTVSWLSPWLHNVWITGRSRWWWERSRANADPRCLRAQTRKAAPVADVRTGETTCFVEKSHLMCAVALVLFCSPARPAGASVWAYMLVKFPVSTVQPNNTVAGEVWQRNNFLSLVVRWKVTCALALVPFCPHAPRRDCNCWCNSL